MINRVKIYKLKEIKSSAGSIVKFTIMNRSKKEKKVFKISRSNPSILCIPPKLWFKFESMTNFSIIVNFINQVHSKNEVEKHPL